MEIRLREVRAGDVLRDPFGNGQVKVMHANHTRGTVHIGVMSNGRLTGLSQRLIYNPNDCVELVERTR